MMFDNFSYLEFKQNVCARIEVTEWRFSEICLLGFFGLKIEFKRLAVNIGFSTKKKVRFRKSVLLTQA
jgi:hypothetical protein